MKRMAFQIAVALALAWVVGVPQVFAQAAFKIPYKFQVGDAKLPKGDYTIIQKDNAQIALRQEATGKEFPVPFTKRLPQPKPPLAEPQLVFDMVGNFAPSYTEYVTDYVLAEVWLPGAQGFLVHTMKGAHKTRIVKGEQAK